MVLLRSCHQGFAVGRVGVGGRREGGGECREVAMMKSFRGLAAKTWLWWGEHCRVR